MSEKKDGRGLHPNSRKALVPGGKAGVRVVLTKEFVKRQVEWLSDNEDVFREAMAELAATSPEKFVNAYLKMIDLIVPKKQDVTLTEGPPPETFQINFGTPTQEQQLAIENAQNVLDITPKEDEQPLGFDTLYELRIGDENSAHDD